MKNSDVKNDLLTKLSKAVLLSTQVPVPVPVFIYDTVRKRKLKEVAIRYSGNGVHQLFTGFTCSMGNNIRTRFYQPDVWHFMDAVKRAQMRTTHSYRVIYPSFLQACVCAVFC